VGLIAGVYLLLPVGFGVAAVWPGRAAVGAPPVGFQEVTVTCADGIRLAAWYAAPADDRGFAIVLLHGAGGSREGVRPYADLLARRGFGVLALDQRGHGASGGATHRLGWEGSRDVEAAAAYLASQPEVRAIGGLGLSMGGEVLLGAAARAPQMRAIVAEGATHRCLAELTALPSERPLVRNWVPRVMFATVGLLSGQRPPQPLLDSMTAAADTRLLLIAGGAVPTELAYNRLYAETLGPRATLWIAPDAPHTGALALYPEAYAERVARFFDEALGAIG
jgi:dienelactone hydrolase